MRLNEHSLKLFLCFNQESSVSRRTADFRQQAARMSSEITFPTYFEILFSKVQVFFTNLSDIEIAILGSIAFFLVVLLICLLTFLVECLVRIRTSESKLSPETYFKRSLKVSEKMSKLKTSEFKHFDIELQDSGNTSMSSREPSLNSSRYSGIADCFIDNYEKRQSTQKLDQVSSLVVWSSLSVFSR